MKKRETETLFDGLEEAATALDACRLIGEAKMLREWAKHMKRELSYDGRVADEVRRSTSTYEANRRGNMLETLERITNVLARRHP
jgi:hypothetical protein